VTAAIAVTVFWFTLYRNFTTYPPGLGLPLAIVAIFFLTALALFRRIHGSMWRGKGGRVPGRSARGRYQHR